MDVLVINPPMVINRKPTFPSFGIDFIVQVLEQNAHKVELLDIDAYRYSREHVCETIHKSRAEVIAIGGLVTVYPYLTWLVPQIRKIKPSCTIILGGPLASSLKERCFDELDIDGIVIGEGEVTVVELLKEICGGRDLSRVQGIAYKADGKILFTPQRGLMPGLDHLLRFDDTRFPMEDLLQTTSGVFQLHVQRGCPSNCTFCFNAFRVVGKNVRYRPAQHVVDDMVYFKNKYKDKITLFALTGECITMSKSWVRDFTRALTDSKLKVKYRVTSRVDTIDAERMAWLKESGCTIISFGLESGSDRILKIMKKNVTAEKSLRAVHLAKKYFNEIQASIILGYVGEDRITLRETVDFCKRLGLRPSFFYATPFPGTELYDTAKANGNIVDEKAYLMDLDRSMISDFNLNLTTMPEHEARMAIAEAKREVENYYFMYDLIHLKIFYYIFYTVKTQGLSTLLNKITNRLRSLSTKINSALPPSEKP